MKQTKTLGVAFGSGGPKGLVHIGVLKCLLRHGVKINFVSGSSVGAWVAAHYALHQNLDLLEEKTVRTVKAKLFTLIDPNFGGGLVKGNKLNNFLAKELGKAKFSNTKIPCQIVATDIVVGAPKVFSSGNLVSAVQASMAVPGIFKPIKIANKYYLDGGLSEPVPDEILRTMGADVVLAINLDNCQTDQGFSVASINSVSRIISRSLGILRHYLAEYSITTADLVIRPQMPVNEPHLWARYFVGKTGADLVALGEQEMEKAWPKLRSLLK